MEKNLIKQLNAIVDEKKYVTKKVLKIKVRLLDTNFSFEPGQFISLKVSNTAYRVYSICSDYKDAGHIELLAAVDHEGLGANFLKNIRVGERVEFIGPAGRFALPTVLADNLLFFVTGTGIAPVLAMLYSLADMGCDSHIAIYFGARNEAEVFEVDTLQQLSTRLPRMTYTICFSQQAQLTSQHAVHDRVTAVLNKLHFTDGAGRYQFFLCGNPNMVADTYEMLINKGINKTSIFREKFTQALSLADSI